MKLNHVRIKIQKFIMHHFNDYRLKKWETFISRNNIEKLGVNLFLNSNLLCEISLKGNDNLPFLTRSSEMENLVITEVSKLIKDYNSNNFEYDGLIYLMYFQNKERLIPLYIGKTETVGKNFNLSANIKNLDKEKFSKKFFARWGDGYKYHIGDLSAVVIEGHDKDKKQIKYTNWADKLFEEYPTNKPKLNFQIKFWCKAWKKDEFGIWNEFGPTRLTFLEYQLIGLCSELFPEYILNTEGQNREQFKKK